MKKRYYLGIDVAKASFEFCFLRGNGACLWRGKLDNDVEAVERLLTQLSVRVTNLSQVHFALESSAVYGNGLLAALHRRELAVSLLNPAQVKFFGISVLRRTKNDRLDASLIARFCLERKPLATRPLRSIEQQLKVLVHQRESRSNEQTRERNRAKKDRFQIQLPSLISHQRKQRLAQLKKELTQLDAAIESLIASDQALKDQNQLLCSIPGIAQLTAAKVLAELAGKEFGSARQLAASAGLTPSEHCSGGSFYGKTRLCKIGNAFLRKALFMPAAAAKRWCQPLRRWALILQARNLHPLAVRGAIMRKLVHTAFGVLSNHQPFNEHLVFIPKTL